jgi:hypothetical protein
MLPAIIDIALGIMEFLVPGGNMKSIHSLSNCDLTVCFGGR